MPARPDARASRLNVVRVATDSAPSSGGYQVSLGPGALARCAEAAARTRPNRPERDVCVVLADAEAWRLHGHRAGDLAAWPRLELAGGEACKSLATLGQVLDFLATSGCSRRSCLVAFGGGTIGDLGGLAASLFKRGMDVVQAPTTLLAQVDAAIGGKTAINLSAGKNLAGTFHHPCAVLADSDVLATLPEREFRSGLGEVLKCALIGGERELARLEVRAADLVARDGHALGEVVTDAVSVKAAIVAEDPEEHGRRRVLNLGHTFGHALEHAAGYGLLPHGEAVAAGIGLALAASARVGLLEDTALPARFEALARALGLPTGLADLATRHREALPPGAFSAEALWAGLAHDKKGAVGAPEFVLVRALGSLALGVPLTADTLAGLLVL